MTSENTTLDRFVEILSNVLLFLLIFGMSATVDHESLVTQLKNKRAVLTGVAMQFLVMPFLGFATLKMLGEERFDPSLGIVLLVVTSSPGGSYSNWWCSMFNAELALSVGMTAVSTMLCTFMLPANLLLYSHAAYGNRENSVLRNIDWTTLFVSLGTVVLAIVTGLKASRVVESTSFRRWANRFGSFSGVALVVLSFLVSTFSEKNDDDVENAADVGIGPNNTRLWRQDAWFYLGVCAPCVLGLVVANLFSCRLRGPERVTLSVECCYQNVGIATSVAVAMFEDGPERARAMNVPLLYGAVEAVVLALYCLAAWKRGWTKAPRNEPFWKMLSNTYEVSDVEEHKNDDDDDDDENDENDDKSETKKRRPLSLGPFRSKSLTAAEELKELELMEGGNAKKRGNSEDTVSTTASAEEEEERRQRQAEINDDAVAERMPPVEEMNDDDDRNDQQQHQQCVRHRSSPFVSARKIPAVSRVRSL